MSNASIVDAEHLYAALDSVIGEDGLPLIARDRITAIHQEGSWLAITFGSPGPTRSVLAQAYDRLAEFWPDRTVELRAGNVVHRGGRGFGRGRHILAVLGGKGGVGKSTISVNLGLTLSAMGAKVGLLDGDLNAPDLHHLLGIAPPAEPRNELWDLWRTSVLPPSEWLRPATRFNVEVASLGLSLDESTAPTIVGRETIAALLRRLVFETMWTADILLVDAPPGTGEEVQAMLRDLPLSAAIMVTTPQDLAQMDAGRTISLLNDSGIPVIGVVLNMAALICPHCGDTIDLFRGSSRLEDDGLPVLGRIPFNTHLSAGADQGMPLVLGDQERTISREFVRIAVQTRRLLAQTSPP
jgi:ATP-binding protein involved in chromosome partitioning